MGGLEDRWARLGRVRAIHRGFMNNGTARERKQASTQAIKCPFWYAYFLFCAACSLAALIKGVKDLSGSALVKNGC